MIRNSGEVYLETLHSFPEVYYETSADGTITTEEWNSICNKPQYLCNFEKTEANYRREEAEAQAKYTFIESYSSAYRAQVSADYSALETELSARIAAGQTFNTSVWSAAETANTSLLTAYDASDTTGDIISYLSGFATRGINLDTNLIGAFGDFQTAWRQDRLDGMTSSDPNYDAYSDDLTWAQRAVAARENAYAELSDAEQDYYDTLFDSAGDYADAQTSASTAYSNRLFNASRTLASNQYGLDAAYQTSKLTAEKENSLDLLDAEFTELLANALAEKNAATEKRQAVSGFIADHQSALTVSSGSFKTLLNSMSVSDLPAQFNTMKNAAEVSADASIASALTQNAQNKQASIDAANADYEYNVRVASNIFITGNLGYLTVSNNAVAAASELYQAALETADDAYNEAVIPAWNDLQDESLRISILLSQAVDIINNGGTVPANYFTDPNISLEVCFVAGTPILMADGTSKPIEEIRPGDMVLAVDHLDPENDTPKPAKVTRFFDNGEKDVVKLLFNNQASGLDTNAMPQEIVCTPGHRFYVINKGWVHAQDLQQGDLCLSASGERVAFLSRENLPGKQYVYNFEVEEKHTYYIGKQKNNTLVHNAGCWDWISEKAYIAGQFFVVAAQNFVNAASGFVNHFGVNYANGIAYTEEKIGILNPDDPIRVPYIPEVEFYSPSQTESLSQRIAMQYFIPWDSDIHNIVDDGTVEKASIKARKMFLISLALQRGAKADGIPREFVLSDWTSVFSVNPSIVKFFLSDNSGNEDKSIMSNPDFWIGTMHDFQAKGSFCITISADKDEHGKSAILIKNMNMTWKLIDRIDANSFFEYNWKVEPIRQGILEGVTDIIGDKCFGLSYDINIIFYEDYNNFNFSYILNNLYK